MVFQNELSKKRAFLENALGPQLADRLAGSSFGSTTELLRTLPQREKDAVNVAYTDSLRIMWIFYTAFAALGIAISIFIKGKELSKEKDTAKTGLEEQERVRLEEKAARRIKKSGLKGSRPGTADTNAEKGDMV